MTSQPESLFANVAIVGLGLMGGSLALALRRQEGVRVLGLDSDPETVNMALSSAVAQVAGSDPAEILPGADLVVYAAPLRTNISLLRDHAPYWSPEAVITDVGSVKLPMVEEAAALDLGCRFVGSHPMAGDHRCGLKAARGDLYQQARVWLTPVTGSPEQDDCVAPDCRLSTVERIARFWQSVGGQCRCLDAAEHDRLMAWVSHLPQVVSSSLAAALADAGMPVAELGPGGRDSTRLAASSPEMWVEILHENREMLSEPLKTMQSIIADLAAALEAGDSRATGELLSRGRRWRIEIQ